MKNSIFKSISKNTKNRIIAISLVISGLCSSLSGCSIFKASSKERHKGEPSTSITSINNYDKDNISVGKNAYQDYYIPDNAFVNVFEEADICFAMVNLSEAIHEYKDNMNDDSLEDVNDILNILINNKNFHQECINTDNINFFDFVSNFKDNSDINTLDSYVNGWLLDYGYDITADYCKELIKYIFDSLDMDVSNFSFDVVDDEYSSILMDLFDSNRSLKLVTNRNNTYTFSNNDILKAYVTMSYESSKKKNGNRNYNRSRNEYISKAFDICNSLLISECSFDDWHVTIEENDELKKYIQDNIIEYTGTVMPIDDYNRYRCEYFYDYIVRNGDTLYDIAERFNTDVSYLLKINNYISYLDKNYNDIGLSTINPGQVIKVPFKEKNLYEKMECEKYVVSAGDSVLYICNKFGVPYTDFIIANPQIANLNLIQIGEVVNIPVSNNQVYVNVGETISIDSDEYSLNDNEESKVSFETATDGLLTISQAIEERGFARGIDLSSFQGKIDWNKLVNDFKPEFTIIRTKWLGYGNREIYDDDKVYENYQKCQEFDIPCMFYTWFDLTDSSKIEPQAQQLIELLNDLQEKYGYTKLPMIFIDYENIDNKYDVTSNPQVSGNNILKAINILEGYGYRVGVYAGIENKRALDAAVPKIKEYDTWLACWGRNETRKFDASYVPTETERNISYDSYTIHQSTENGIVSGINENTVDLNYMFADYPKILSENYEKVKSMR